MTSKSVWSEALLYLCCTQRLGALGRQEPGTSGESSPGYHAAIPSEALPSHWHREAVNLLLIALTSTSLSLVWRKSLPLSSGWPSRALPSTYLFHEPHCMNQKRSPCQATCFPAAKIPSVRPPTGYERPTRRTVTVGASGNILPYILEPEEQE